eukprot:1160059-Pelagomonas_calceolata.AAC.9
MGASVMRYPEQYSALRSVMQDLLSPGRSMSAPASNRTAKSASPETALMSRAPQIFPDARGWSNLLDLWDEGVERTGRFIP